MTSAVYICASLIVSMSRMHYCLQLKLARCETRGRVFQQQTLTCLSDLACCEPHPSLVQIPDIHEGFGFSLTALWEYKRNERD